MGAVKSHLQGDKNSPTIFALLVDNINKMSESEQKSLWVQINKDKIATLGKEIDASVIPHNFSANEIDSLINEARKNAKNRQKS